MASDTAVGSRSRARHMSSSMKVNLRPLSTVETAAPLEEEEGSSASLGGFRRLARLSDLATARVGRRRRRGFGGRGEREWGNWRGEERERDILFCFGGGDGVDCGLWIRVLGGRGKQKGGVFTTFKIILQETPCTVRILEEITFFFFCQKIL